MSRLSTRERTMRRNTLSVGLLLVAVAGLAGCAIQPDAGPRDIPEEDRGSFAERPTGDEAAGTSLIFLMAPNEPGEAPQLRSAMRDVAPAPQAVVRSLMAGPNATEREAGLDSKIPTDVIVNDVSTLGRVTTVDLSAAFDEIDAVDLPYAIAQIVTTITALETVDAVQIRVDGEDRVWPRGDGELTAEPLTRYDYPGLVESTQPPYPAIPSPVS
jgi:hypothetical protein